MSKRIGSSGLYRIYATLVSCGIDVRALWRSVKRVGWFMGSWRAYNRLPSRPTLQARTVNLFPCLTDIDNKAGSATGHYFHQDLLVARKIFSAAPTRHVDVGSRIDGFISHLLTFMPVEVVDIRPLQSAIPGLTFVQSDATALAEFADGSVASVSALHSAEHFGLGRYGDPIDPDACFRFMAALQRVLAPSGKLYFSVPVGRERLEFNAHRVFSPDTIISAFADLCLVSFSYVDDNGQLISNVPPSIATGAEFGCGIFEFTK